MKPVASGAFEAERFQPALLDQPPLPPELIRFIQALARVAAREDYDYFCRTGRVLGYDGTDQE